MNETGEHTVGKIDECRGCSASVRLAPGEVQRILANYLAKYPHAPIAGAALHAQRLAICSACPDLLYGTTCRHCGCLVELRTKLARSACPAPLPRWQAQDAAEAFKK